MNQPNNLFNNLPNLLTGEDFCPLLNCQNVVIERIVSSNQPEQKIYQQVQDEWVILLQGLAKLKVDDEIVTLQKGDYLFIPAHTPHQVLETSTNSIWLAVHIY
jgi:cupin 2 domain-containing protein